MKELHICKRCELFLITRFSKWKYAFARVLPYILILFSVLACMIILFSNLFDRVPNLYYWFSERKLPITYELSGKVEILNTDNEIINTVVDVFVGGYSTKLNGTEVDLTFSSSKTNEILVGIRYEVHGETRWYTKCITVENGKHLIYEEFIIYE